MFHLTVTLDIILPSHKVPQEITPIHEIDLVTEEETQILKGSWQIAILLAPAHPVFVGLSMSLRVHSREEHIILEYVLDIVSHHLIFLFCRVGRWAIDCPSLQLFEHHVITLDLIVRLTAIGRTIE